MKQKLVGLVLFCILSVFGFQASAQLKGFSIGPYFEAAWPKGDFAATNANGIGAGIAADIKLGSKINLMGAAGYLRFGRKAGSENPKALGAVPLRVGLKYKLPIVYLKMESGTAKFSNDNGSALILSPGIGIRILGLDVQGSYETWLEDEGRSFASLKISYHF
jgi:hypothetical protein